MCHLNEGTNRRNFNRKGVMHVFSTLYEYLLIFLGLTWYMSLFMLVSIYLNDFKQIFKTEK